MSEWWTYRIGDFLMFSPRTYARLFELYNRDVWPLHVLTLLAAAWIFWRRDRASAWLLAAAWVWVGWAFHWERYREILWAAGWFAGASVMLAVLLVVLAPPRAEAPQRAALGLFVFGWLIQPIAVWLLTGRMEIFGIAPDPTATVTLAFLLAGRARRALLIIPMTWVAISGATAWAMGSWDALLALVILCVSARGFVAPRPMK